MSEIRPPKMCGLFKPGHNPHWIQMRKGLEDDENIPTSGRFIESRSDGTVVIEVDGSELSLWNHEPERLADTVSMSGAVIEYQPRWGLLWASSDNARYAFCVARSPDDRVPCLFLPPTGSPVKRLETFGGFTMSVDDLNRERL